MKSPIVDNILHKIKQVSGLYYRLIIVVATSGSGKTAILRQVHNQTDLPIINVNIELSRRMLDLPERQRILQLNKLISEIIDKHKCEAVLLDNVELLFDVSLKQDPLRLLRNISRRKTIITTWNGTIKNNYLIYAKPDHPEYKRYPINNLIIICPEVKT